MTSFIIFGGVKVTFFKKKVRFKQLPLNVKQRFEFSYHLIDGEGMVSVLVRIVRFLADKPLDFHNAIFSVSPIYFKV